MIREILYDFFRGFIASIRLDLFMNNICLDFIPLTQLKLVNQMWKVCEFNLVAFLIIPYTLFYFVPFLYSPIYGLIKIFSLFFHSMYYFDILQKMSSKVGTKKGSA